MRPSFCGAGLSFDVLIPFDYSSFFQVAKNNHGGRRPGAGRKSKAEEKRISDLLRPFDGLALAKLKELIESGDRAALKLFFAYRWGQPAARAEIIDVSKLTPAEVDDLLKRILGDADN